MASKFASWWQYIRKHWIAAIIIAFVIVMVLIFAGYLFDWTGFNGYNKVTTTHIISGTNAGTVTRTEEYQPGKALWDWLQLLIIPLVLAVGGLSFNQIQKNREQRATEQRAETERKAAEQQAKLERDLTRDNQQEALLQAYLDKMSELLLEKDLRKSKREGEERTIARARTLTVLRGLYASK